MPISKVGSTVTYTAPSNRRFLEEWGVATDADFSVVCDRDELKQMKFDASAMTTNTAVTFAAGANTSSVTFTLPTTSGTFAKTADLTNEILQYNAPANGATVNITSGVTALVLEPAGTIAGATVNLPNATTDGYTVAISSTAIVTTLTLGVVSGATATIVNALAAFAANGFVKYIYRLSTDKWYRIG